MSGFDDDGPDSDVDPILINDNPEYIDYLREGRPGYQIPYSYQINQALEKRAQEQGPYTAPSTAWWMWILIILFILMMCAIAIGPAIL